MTPETLGTIIHVPQLAPPPPEVRAKGVLGARILIGEAHRIWAAAAGSQILVAAGRTVRGATLEPLVVGLETRSSTRDFYRLPEDLIS